MFNNKIYLSSTVFIILSFMVLVDYKKIRNK